MSGFQGIHIITHLGIGGAQDATLNQLARSRFLEGERILLTGEVGELHDRAARDERIRVVKVSALRRSMHPGRDAVALVQLIQALREHRDSNLRLLVHTHSPKAGWLGRVAARALRADRVVHSFHGFGHGHGRFGRVFKWAEIAAAPLADGYTFDSESNRAQALTEGLVSSQPSVVVHCGVDESDFRFDPVARESVRREFAVTGDLVVTLANFKPQKDPLTFVRVAERVIRRRPNTTFAYAGDGPLREQVEREIRRLGVEREVRILGWRRDPARLLSAADVFLLTSRWEGLPQSFGQAMCVGLPIVATDVDGAREAVIDGVSGYVRPAGDVTKLSDALLKLIEAPALRKSMGAEAKRRARRFSNETMIERLDEFYTRVVAAS